MTSSPPFQDDGPRATLLDAGPIQLARLLADGVVSSTELITEALARIEATQATVNAFRRVRARAALAEAAEADRRLAAGERASLLGVPVAIKDDVDIAGEPTAFGCVGEFPIASEDSDLVRILRQAGAVIVGKTNAPELGQWPFTEGTAFGATRNPWNLGHTPGGSSGGSAAAVAAGLVPVAVGSDGAGSVRIPAGWSHLVGMKPQHGRLAARPGRELFFGVSTLGPLARTVADAALVLDVLCGHVRSTNGPGPFLAAASRDPGRLRIALSLRPAFNGYRSRLAPEVEASVRRLAGVLTDLGHDVFPAEPSYGLIGLNFLPRSALGLHKWSARVPDPALLDPRTRHNLRSGYWVGRPLLGFGRASSGWFERRVGRIFDTADVVLAPTTAVGPPKVGAWRDLGPGGLSRAMIAACPYAWPWNALGWPAVNVPAGMTADGLPVGAQLLGPAAGEARLISLAAQLESKERWQDRRPARHW